MRRALLLLPLPFLLSGCFGLVVTGATEVAATVMENRSAGRKVDDKVLYADVYNQFTQADRSDLIGEVNLNTRFARVMLTGTVKSEADAQTAVALAWKAKNIEEVINELVVNPNKSFMGTANDSLVKRNLGARLLITKDVWVINYSLDVQNNVAYIIGRVKDQSELNRVINVARVTKGIKRVVSHLQINTDTDGPAKSGGGATNAAAQVDTVESRPVSSPYSSSKGPIKTAPISQDSTRPNSGGF